MTAAAKAWLRFVALVKRGEVSSADGRRRRTRPPRSRPVRPTEPRLDPVRQLELEGACDTVLDQILSWPEVKARGEPIGTPAESEFGGASWLHAGKSHHEAHGPDDLKLRLLSCAVGC